MMRFFEQMDLRLVLDNFLLLVFRSNNDDHLLTRLHNDVRNIANVNPIHQTVFRSSIAVGAENECNIASEISSLKNGVGHHDIMRTRQQVGEMQRKAHEIHAGSISKASTFV